MSDITQSSGVHPNVVFSANTAPADEWMAENYGDHTIELDVSEAQEFKDAATEAGFSISSL